MSTSERAGQAGQALVELAIVLPVLVVLLLGGIEGGRLFFTYVALEEAVHEGATYGAQQPADSSGIVARVVESSSQQEVQDATVDMTDCDADDVTVSATTTFPAITPLGSLFAGLFSGGSFTIRATVVATNLQGACT